MLAAHLCSRGRAAQRSHMHLFAKLARVQHNPLQLQLKAGPYRHWTTHGTCTCVCSHMQQALASSCSRGRQLRAVLHAVRHAVWQASAATTVISRSRRAHAAEAGGSRTAGQRSSSPQQQASTRALRRQKQAAAAFRCAVRRAVWQTSAARCSAAAAVRQSSMLSNSAAAASSGCSTLRSPKPRP